MPAAPSDVLARGTNGLPAMPTTSTGFVVAAACTLWPMSAFRLAIFSRIAGCWRASSRIVRGMAFASVVRQAATIPSRIAAAMKNPASSDGEDAALEVADGALQLRRRVHDERAVLRDRLSQRTTGDKEDACRYGEIGGRDDANAVGFALVAENRHALRIDADRRDFADVYAPGRNVG